MMRGGFVSRPKNCTGDSSFVQEAFCAAAGASSTKILKKSINILFQNIVPIHVDNLFLE